MYCVCIYIYTIIFTYVLFQWFQYPSSQLAQDHCRARNAADRTWHNSRREGLKFFSQKNVDISLDISFELSWNYGTQKSNGLAICFPMQTIIWRILEVDICHFRMGLTSSSGRLNAISWNCNAPPRAWRYGNGQMPSDAMRLGHRPSIRAFRGFRGISFERMDI